MQITGLSWDEIQAAARACQVDAIENARGDGCLLRPLPDHLGGGRYRKFSPWTGRKVYAVCWHGHRDFMRECFARGATRITTCLKRYNGPEDFEATHESTECLLGDRHCEC